MKSKEALMAKEVLSFYDKEIWKGLRELFPSIPEHCTSVKIECSLDDAWRINAEFIVVKENCDADK